MPPSPSLRSIRKWSSECPGWRITLELRCGNERRGKENAPPHTRRGVRLAKRDGLLQVLRDELRHLEHAHLALPAENRTKLFVRVDHGALGLVLKLVLLDVRPQLLRDLGARNGLAAHDLGERAGRSQRLHERGIRLA